MVRKEWKREERAGRADQEEQEEEEAVEKERSSYEFRGGPAREMRIARLGWLHGRPSWAQTG